MIAIHGCRLHPLRVHDDERGWLYEVIRTDDEDYLPVAQVYLAAAHRGVAKAFHAHTKQWDRFVCVQGVAKIGLVDLRGPVYRATADATIADPDHPRWWTYGLGEPFTSAFPSDEAWMDALGLSLEKDGASTTFLAQDSVILRGDRPAILFIPPGVAHGQMAITEESVILNMPTELYNRSRPDEVRIPFNAFGFEWPIKSR